MFGNFVVTDNFRRFKLKSLFLSCFFSRPTKVIFSVDANEMLVAVVIGEQKPDSNDDPVQQRGPLAVGARAQSGVVRVEIAAVDQPTNKIPVRMVESVMRFPADRCNY